MSNKMKLTIGIVLAILTAVLFGWNSVSLSRAQQSAAFLRLSPDVPVAQGSAIPDSAITVIRLPESAGALKNVALPDTPEDRQWLKGRKVEHDVPPGSILLYQFFADAPTVRFAANIRPGMRAVSIRVDAAAAVSFLLEPGSLVDVVGSLKPEMKLPVPTKGEPVTKGEPLDLSRLGKDSTETILQAVRVLAVGGATSRGAYVNPQSQAPGVGTVTLEVSPEQAEKLVFAQNHLQGGGLTLLLRNPADTAAADLPAKTYGETSSTAQ
jgi:pilus assembly protein CpaB